MPLRNPTTFTRYFLRYAPDAGESSPLALVEQRLADGRVDDDVRLRVDLPLLLGQAQARERHWLAPQVLAAVPRIRNS